MSNKFEAPEERRIDPATGSAIDIANDATEPDPTQAWDIPKIPVVKDEELFTLGYEGIILSGNTGSPSDYLKLKFQIEPEKTLVKKSGISDKQSLPQKDLTSGIDERSWPFYDSTSRDTFGPRKRDALLSGRLGFESLDAERINTFTGKPIIAPEGMRFTGRYTSLGGGDFVPELEIDVRDNQGSETDWVLKQDPTDPKRPLFDTTRITTPDPYAFSDKDKEDKYFKKRLDPYFSTKDHQEIIPHNNDDSGIRRNVQLLDPYVDLPKLSQSVFDEWPVERLLSEMRERLIQQEAEVHRSLSEDSSDSQASSDDHMLE